MSSRLWILHLCLAVMVITGHFVHDVVASPLISIHKRSPRRMPRARYRGGYMFGKRNSPIPSAVPMNSPKLTDILDSNPLSNSEFAQILKNDPIILEKVAALLDINDDGYITLSDFM